MAEHVPMVTSVDVIDFFGDRKICDQCGATVSTYGDLCAVALDVRCEGFRTYDDLLALVYDRKKREGRDNA